MPFRSNGASKSILYGYLLELVRYIEDGFNMGRMKIWPVVVWNETQVVGKVFWKELARYFGISRPSVSQAIKRDEKFAKENDVKLLS